MGNAASDLDCCRLSPSERQQMRLGKTWVVAEARDPSAGEANKSKSREQLVCRVRASAAGHKIITKEESVAGRLDQVSRLEEELVRRRRWLVSVMSRDGERQQGPSLHEHLSELNRIEEDLSDQRRRLEDALKHVRSVAASHSCGQTGGGEPHKADAYASSDKSDAELETEDAPAHSTVRASARMHFLNAL